VKTIAQIRMVRGGRRSCQTSEEAVHVRVYVAAPLRRASWIGNGPSTTHYPIGVQLLVIFHGAGGPRRHTFRRTVRDAGSRKKRRKRIQPGKLLFCFS